MFTITTHARPDRWHGRMLAREITSRHEVATLEEARTAAYRATGDVIGWDDDSLAANELLYQAKELPESGGTIGPLPDGTVIEVRPA